MSKVTSPAAAASAALADGAAYRCREYGLELVSDTICPDGPECRALSCLHRVPVCFGIAGACPERILEECRWADRCKAETAKLAKGITEELSIAPGAVAESTNAGEDLAAADPDLEAELEAQAEEERAPERPLMPALAPRYGVIDLNTGDLTQLTLTGAEWRQYKVASLHVSGSYSDEFVLELFSQLVSGGELTPGALVEVTHRGVVKEYAPVYKKGTHEGKAVIAYQTIQSVRVIGHATGAPGHFEAAQNVDGEPKLLEQTGPVISGSLEFTAEPTEGLTDLLEKEPATLPECFSEPAGPLEDCEICEVRERCLEADAAMQDAHSQAEADGDALEEVAGDE